MRHLLPKERPEREVKERVSNSLITVSLPPRPWSLEVSERLTFLGLMGTRGITTGTQKTVEPSTIQEAVDTTRPELKLETLTSWWSGGRTVLYRCDLVAGLLLRKLRSHGIRLLAKTLDYAIHAIRGL